MLQRVMHAKQRATMLYVEHVAGASWQLELPITQKNFSCKLLLAPVSPPQG